MEPVKAKDLHRTHTSLDKQPWARSVTKLLGVSTRINARIIGITGHSRNVGVSLIAQGLANANLEFGKSTVLLNASGKESDATVFEVNTPQNSPPQGANDTQSPALTRVNLTDVDVEQPAGRIQYRRAFDETAGDVDTIIIDLPPVCQTAAQTSAVFKSVGAACDLVFLVCLTGIVTKPELDDCLERCNINGVKLAGIILNDWHLPASNLLSDT